MYSHKLLVSDIEMVYLQYYVSGKLILSDLEIVDLYHYFLMNL